jgi:Tol biopolymer transport system component
MRLLITLVVFSFIAISACKREEYNDPECAIPAIVPYQPYSDPVWYPNGQLLGFNHTPQAGVFANGTAPCIWYMNSVKQDSAGFYLMNKDGTGFRRVTNFYLNTPAWSPDGNWIAFSSPPHIYKMCFDGYTFDTAHIIKLTDSGANFYPSWTANSDTIYFDSNVGTNGQGYYIWKMANDGSGKIGFPNTGRQPFVGSDGNLYFVKGSAGQPEVFKMKKDGSDITQITFNSKNGIRRSPKYNNGKVFFWDGAIFSTPINQYLPKELCLSTETYDISNDSEIVYGTAEYGITDKRFCTLWIMNADGSNKRQLTFNQF